MNQRPSISDQSRMQAGEILSNGATVICHKGSFVLATWERATGTEYITWRLQGGTTVSGHYFTNPWDAADDFQERLDLNIGADNA